MELFEKIKLKEDFDNYRKGDIGIIVEIYNNKDAFIEMIDKDGDTIGVIYCVPIAILEKA